MCEGYIPEHLAMSAGRQRDVRGGSCDILQRDSVLLADSSPSGDALEAELLATSMLTARVHSAQDALTFLRDCEPRWALIELRIGADCGLELLSEMARLKLPTKTVVATMYGTIEAAREAVNRGAAGFFAKPVTLDQIVNSICKQSKSEPPPRAAGDHLWMSVDDMRGRYIREVVTQSGSLARAAKALNVDRRSLRRMMNRLHLR